MATELHPLLYRIDSEHSEIAFSVKHLMISKVKGRFERFRGEFCLDPGAPLKSEFEGSIEVASIGTQDAARDVYLRTSEFFDPPKYPEMRFHSTGIHQETEGPIRIIGVLQIKEVSGSVELELTAGANVFEGVLPPSSFEMEARGRIDRRSFGLVWPPAIEAGGVLVGNEVGITLRIRWVRR
jgi:polyisoprenoid-binding protein YceI